MANRYLNRFYDPSDTTQVTLYTTPAESRAIIQNIQLVNESGSKVFKVFITDTSKQHLQHIKLPMQVLLALLHATWPKDH